MIENTGLEKKSSSRNVHGQQFCFSGTSLLYRPTDHRQSYIYIISANGRLIDLISKVVFSHCWADKQTTHLLHHIDRSISASSLLNAKLMYSFSVNILEFLDIDLQ